ncbi:MAG TPA: ATP-binding protein [Ardenticatenaceae bacterium]|jgi:two-component system phosphate regulon sensor histidine kinase PhoR
MEPLIAIILLLVIAALLIHTSRLQAERATWQGEVRRVLRAAEGQTEAQEAELAWRRVLSDTAPLSIVVTDEQKRLLYANEAAQRLFGPYEAGEGAIQRLRDHNLEALLDEALQEGQAQSLVVHVKEQQFLASARAWASAHKAVAGTALFLQDITQLNRLARARRDMAANLSHELRTPLSSVKLMTETLLDLGREEPELVHRLATRIATENDAMIRLVEDLTALNWIESGRTPLRLERANLREVVERRLQRFAPQLELKQLRFELAAPDEAIVALDTERFAQVLTNVLDNAIKFSRPGGTIHLASARRDSVTTLSIRDEGPGILSTDLPRIFERFYKGDRVRTRSSASGTGLGLAIAKHLVEAHGGTIRAESQFGHGATFIITLPSE